MRAAVRTLRRLRVISDKGHRERARARKRERVEKEKRKRKRMGEEKREREKDGERTTIPPADFARRDYYGISS